VDSKPAASKSSTGASNWNFVQPKNIINAQAHVRRWNDATQVVFVGFMGAHGKSQRVFVGECKTHTYSLPRAGDSHRNVGDPHGIARFHTPPHAANDRDVVGFHILPFQPTDWLNPP
jgi:hypothetical protein